MPTKMGNGGHGHEEYDPSTGRYVKQGMGGSGNEDNTSSITTGSFLRNITDDELEAVRAFLANKDENNVLDGKPVIQREIIKDSFIKGKTVEECVQIGNEIVGSPIVNYIAGTNIDAANQMNEALFDIKKDFPVFFTNLMGFNNGAQKNVEKIIKDKMQNFENIAKTLNVKHSMVKSMYRSNLEKIISTLNSIDLDPLGTILGRHTSYGRLDFDPETLSRIGYKYVGSIILNKKQTVVNDIKNVEERNQRELVDTNYTYPNGKGAIYSTASHELGHHIDYTIQNFLSSREKGNLTRWLNTLKEKYTLTDETSRYSRTSREEFIAEAFNDFYSNGEKAKPFNKQIVNRFKELYKEKVK